MKRYEFTDKNGIDIEVQVTGSYHDCDDKDLYVVAGNGFEEEFEECGAGDDVLCALEAAGLEFDEKPRKFAEDVIDWCMIVEDMTLAELAAEAL